ncbi:MAG: hypothetical protein KKB50_08365 [Planctomycetes bacterium]|nr:hypothetical protein [Planctomycetota bacterium]
MHRTMKFRLAAIVACALGLACANATLGDEGDPWAQQALSGAVENAQLPVGSPDAIHAIVAIVARATEVQTRAGQWLLPPGTLVDDVVWDENVLEVHLTIPVANGDWHMWPGDPETLSNALSGPYMCDGTFGGTRIRVRAGQDQPYGTLEQFLLPRSAPVPDVLEPQERPAQWDAPGADDTHRLTGPPSQANRQPVGALSGVTVYASAGHGWTAGTSSWFLQRPVLLDMCEDYGNIDMLNFFVNYAFNAGATVVPFRPVGWQTIEIVLDNDDPGVTYTGTWSNGSSSKYYENGATISGIVYKWISSETVETATARYTPNITVTDFYPVYCFSVAGSNRSLQTYRVSHSGGIAEITIDHRETGSGWIWLGNYYLEAGGDNYVEITNESSLAGAIIADAVRWGGGVGDIWRSGPDSISGYPRDEECQRYFAHSELGNNASGFDSDIWDGGGDDAGDNVRTGGKWAREMNQVPGGGILTDRWKRVHLEFHTNASGGGARGQICLITDLGATTYQVQFANMLSDEFDADMLIIDDEFEHEWYDRSSATYTSSYGAICTGANSDEFDATIIELAFHDNQLDAELLRDDRVRSAMARACVHGIIKFLNTLPGSQVPLAFAPDTPRYFRAEDPGNGDVRLSWQAPLVDGARGDAATGYVVYQSSNGYGFGNPIILGNVLTTTVAGVPVGETRYFRVAATNAGGESMPTEVLAVRRPTTGTANLLIVNGFDRLRRQINPIQTFTQPPAYAGDWIERQMWRRSNSFDYIVQHAEALAANDIGFASCSNDAVINSYVQLGHYDIVVWILGTESTEDATFSANEQSKVEAFLVDGGALFVSGAEIGYDLIGQGNGASFMQNTLRTGYAADDAGTFDVTAVAGSILDGVGSFDFDPANGAPYEVYSPDVLTAGTDAQACLHYVGGSGTVAGVQYTGEIYNVVVFGFPFETISSPTVRAAVMQRVIDFLESASGPLPFDYDRDNDVDMTDFNVFVWCYSGPDDPYPGGHFCLDMDGDEDYDVDLADFSLFQQYFTGAGGP